MPLTIAIREPETGAPDIVEFHYSVALHNRGTDFKVYKNTWDSGEFEFDDEHDTTLLRHLLSSLMSAEAGVMTIRVNSPYVIKTQRCAAVTLESVCERVEQAAKLSGEEVVMKTVEPGGIPLT